ncbi:MAG: hypothetical protein LLG14_07145 [Nocardiaceae bacterium]|nr:hypothetical protein [Nocardiaceae bacterium]
MLSPDAIVHCPRGRRACAALIAAHTPLKWASIVHGPHAHRARLIEAIGEVAPALVVNLPPSALLNAVRAATDFASYWQGPDAEDQLLDDKSVIEALRPTAEALCHAPGTSWWNEPVALTEQRLVEWYDPRGWPRTALFGGIHHLEIWRDQTTAKEARARRELSADPSEMHSGEWWSIPAFSETPQTTRALGPLGAVGLQAVEDSLGWEDSRVWNIAVRDDPHVLEIRSPQDWAELVTRFPLDVTAIRRHDWYRATGENTNWFIPDWAAVALEYDAVHLTVFGYLTTAGRPLSVRNGSTLLAGWNPDATFWLHRNHIQFDGDAVEWRRVGEEWHPLR